MTLQDTPGVLFPPQLGVNAIGSMLLDAAGEKAAFVFAAPKSGTIDRVCFRTVAVTTPTNTDVRIESIADASGDPSGSLWAANTNATVASGSMLANTWIEATLTAGAVVVAGDVIAVVIAPSGTPNLNIGRFATTATLFGLPYSDIFGASWVKSGNTFAGAVRYSDGSYPHIPSVWPATNLATQGLTSTGTPDEIGNVINLPFRCRVSGIQADTASTSSTSNQSFQIYDASDNLLASKNWDANALQGANTILQTLDTPVILEPNVDYRVTAKALTTTNRTFRYLDVTSTALAAALPMGHRCYYTQRTDLGAWSDTVTRRLGMGLIIDQLEDGAGGGAASPVSYGFAG